MKTRSFYIIRNTPMMDIEPHQDTVNSIIIGTLSSKWARLGCRLVFEQRNDPLDLTVIKNL